MFNLNYSTSYFLNNIDYRHLIHSENPTIKNRRTRYNIIIGWHEYNYDWIK